MTRPVIVEFVGVPGSGKTTLSKALAQELHAVLLNSDAMRIAMWGSREEIENAHSFTHNRAYNNKLTFGGLNYAAEQTIAAGYSVVYDCNANSIAERAEKHDIAKKYDALSLVVRIKVPYEVSLERIQTRDDTHDQRRFTAEKAKEVLERFIAQIEEPTSPERIIEIPGDIDQQEQLAIFRSKLAEYMSS
jgi:predicted kinase